MAISLLQKLIASRIAENNSLIVTLTTLDNPGWSLTTSGLNTSKESRLFEDRSDTDWFFALVKDNDFRSSGDPFKLIKIFDNFLSLIGGEDPVRNTKRYRDDANILEILQYWYFSQCNEDWEHLYGVEAIFSNSRGCQATFDLADTELEEEEIPSNLLSIRSSSLRIKLEDQKLIAEGSINDFREILSFFITWVNRTSCS